MKKLTAVLLAIMVTISACASPSGNSGDVNSGSAGSEANGSRTASEGATREAGAAEFQLEIDEGFVSAEESGEAEEELRGLDLNVVCHDEFPFNRKG